MSADNLLDKAQRALIAARRGFDQGDIETCADRAYYAVFYAAWALLEFAGQPRPKTHNGLIAAFSRTYVLSGRMQPAAAAVLSRLQNLRLVADYTLDTIPVPDAARAVAEAGDFVALAARLVAADPGDGTGPADTR